MEKVIRAISSIFFLILFFPPAGIAWGELVCTVRHSSNEQCTPHLTIENGTITLTGDGSFTLQGSYNSCYHMDNITITGKQHQSTTVNGLTFELLATEFNQSSNSTQYFPRTIGTIILNTKSMEGFYFDVWASIRSLGAHWQSPFTRNIVCKTK
ncbi:MAG: hypothetical protein ACI8ZB_004947 [Desulforhopalus sp.]|jgi:hypothetical protein